MIRGIEFSIWSSSDIRKQSVVEVKNASKTVENGISIENGLRDERMGPLHIWSKCKTCGLNKRKCPGHYGHIELVAPVYHISWVTHIIYWLRCICVDCGKSLIKDLKKPDLCRNKHLNFYSKNASKKCTCGRRQPKYSWSKKSGCILRGKEKYPIQDVVKHLESMEEEVLNKVDMCHPKDMILTCIPVPPPLVRPPIMNGKNIRGEDDITYRLIQIMRQNIKLAKIIKEKRPQHIVDGVKEHLQMAVTGYINHHKLPNTTTRSSKREYTSLTARLKTKEGRIRGNLMGKRCDFTGRSVITGDDCLGMHEVGIPQSMAKTLTIPVKVTSYNIVELKKMVLTDAVRFVVRPNNSRIDMSCINRSNISIDVGWTVERCLQDGDIVCFNRQPSLHKMSFMAHEVRVMPYSTLRMNLSCTSPYNADFDGDEMNIHALQTPQSQAEARFLMAVKYQIVSPQSNRPVMSVIQDTLIGAYLMSDDGVKIKKSVFFDCVFAMPGWDGELDIKEIYTGKELISMTLPMVNWKKGPVEILKGKLIRGQLNKKCLGTSHGSLIHVIFNDCGPEQTILFINRLQHIVHKWLHITGFSIGISDMISTASSAIHDEIKTAFEDVKYMSKEAEINARLNACRDTMGHAVQKPLDNKNRLYCMVNSGSKGSSINISQVMAVVGQQSLCGKRIPNTWTDRTLPHFRKGSSLPHEKGFIQHSYIEGLEPHELWFHAIAGREGIIDTACKTSVTGYLQRKFMKALENLKICMDLSVRNSDGSILQFSYGDDGFDAMKIEKQKIPTFNGDFCGTEKEIQQLKKDYDFLKENNFVRDPSLIDTDDYMLPIPVKRIIHNAQTLFSIPSATIKDPEYIYDQTNALVKTVDNRMLQILLRSHLNSKKLMDLSITKDQLSQIILDIKNKLNTIYVNPGECVGAIAAQSMGEPATQMTLNTFHFAGVASKNVTLGIPRLNECINCIEKIKTPLTTFEADKSIYNKIKYFSLESLVESYKVVDIPDPKEVKDFFIFPDPGYRKLKTKTLVLYLKKFDDVIAVKECLSDCICAYSDGPYAVFHVQDDDDIGIKYEKDLKKRTVRGIPGAGLTQYRDNKIETSLTDLSKIFEIVGVAYNKILCNDIHQVANVYGIEAARHTILNEIRSILGFYGIYVNVRHILLCIDWICHRGILTPMTRHGIRNMDQSPLKRSTFEEVVEVFNQAACYKEKDDLNGISECIVMGIPPKLGTETVSVFTDEGVVERFKKDPPTTDQQMDEMFEDEPWIKFEETEQIANKVNQYINPFVGGEDSFVPVAPASTFGPPFGQAQFGQAQMAPQFGQPQFGQAQFGQAQMAPQFGQPQFGQAQFGQAQMAQFGQPQFGQAQMAQFGQPQFGQAQMAQFGQPQFGQAQITKKRKISPPPSPCYSPASPAYSPKSPCYSPTSPAYSPQSPAYSPTSPAYGPQSPAYSPTSPSYNPKSPCYSPTSPSYNPKSPCYSPTSPAYSPQSPAYSPNSPAYDPSTSMPPLDLGDPMVPR